MTAFPYRPIIDDGLRPRAPRLGAPHESGANDQKDGGRGRSGRSSAGPQWHVVERPLALPNTGQAAERKTPPLSGFL